MKSIQMRLSTTFDMGVLKIYRVKNVFKQAGPNPEFLQTGLFLDSFFPRVN